MQIEANLIPLSNASFCVQTIVSWDGLWVEACGNQAYLCEGGSTSRT